MWRIMVLLACLLICGCEDEDQYEKEYKKRNPVFGISVVSVVVVVVVVELMRRRYVAVKNT